MRMQSPASSGLLPASYSRRRRNRPNESSSVVDGNTSSSATGAGAVVVSSYYHNSNIIDNTDPSIDNNNNVGLSPRRGRKPIYSFATDSDKTSDDDDENDENRHGNTSRQPMNNRTDAYEEGYEDVLDKPLKLSDFSINDRCYQRYITEGKRASYRGIGGKNMTNANKGGGILDPQFLAKVSAGVSFVGMIFLIWVAIMMETQPLFIKGVSVKATTSANNNMNNNNMGVQDSTYIFRKETSNALKAAAAYFVTMVLSLIYLQSKEMNWEVSNPAVGRICHLRRLIVSSYWRYRRRHYDAIPDNGSVLPTYTNNSGSGGGVVGDGKRKVKKRHRRRAREGGGGGGGVGGGAIEGVLGKIKSWGIGGGSGRSGRKKDR